MHMGMLLLGESMQCKQLLLQPFSHNEALHQPLLQRLKSTLSIQHYKYSLAI